MIRKMKIKIRMTKKARRRILRIQPLIRLEIDKAIERAARKLEKEIKKQMREL